MTIVPASEKMTVLESIESADSKTKLQMILKKRFMKFSLMKKKRRFKEPFPTAKN
jgi:hypothetical protein